MFTQWMFARFPSMGVRVLLLVRFTRPVRTVSMVVKEPKVGNSAIKGRNVVSFGIDRPGLLEVLDKMPTL